jgi:hypothetical protein
MAAPIAFPLVALGAWIGYAIQSRPWLNHEAMAIMLALLITLPALMAAESANEPEPSVRAVDTDVIVDAPPEKVWQYVIAFPPLPEPGDWLFQTGIAYPQRAEIQGTGVGAVRRCVFSTGTFVEPIEAWDPPVLLGFRVVDQPQPMREWSPYAIHPAHLDNYLHNRKGQFLLEPLPGGRTRLVGTTWYSNRMWPAAYWNLWSDYIIHRIHGRVLLHIKKLAESPEVKRGVERPPRPRLRPPSSGLASSPGRSPYRVAAQRSRSDSSRSSTRLWRTSSLKGRLSCR